MNFKETLTKFGYHQILRTPAISPGCKAVLFQTVKEYEVFSFTIIIYGTEQKITFQSQTVLSILPVFRAIHTYTCEEKQLK